MKRSSIFTNRQISRKDYYECFYFNKYFAILMTNKILPHAKGSCIANFPAVVL
jgi:hypothetical protein